MKNVRLKFFGKVQGVFFRVFVKKQAERFGLFGWVRNKSDGTVESEVEGGEERLNKFVQQCKKGSPSSKVERVESIFSNKMKDYNKFEILS